MNKILIGFCIFLFLVSIAFLLNQQYTKEEQMEEKIYQGPVPENYDVDHFRKTGETKLIGEVNND